MVDGKMVIIPIISLLGILIGALVAHIAREELEEGKRPIRLLTSFLLLLTLFSLFITLTFPSRLSQLAYGFVILGLTIVETFSGKPFLVPVLTPLLLFVSLFFVPKEFILVNGSLFLLAGLPLGTEAYYVTTQLREESRRNHSRKDRSSR